MPITYPVKYARACRTCRTAAPTQVAVDILAATSSICDALILLSFAATVTPEARATVAEHEQEEDG